MQSYLKSLKELRDEYTKRKNECLESQDADKFDDVEGLEGCIVAVNKCIEIFKLSEKQVVKNMNFIISLCDGWKKSIPEGLTPMGYVTLSYDGDMDIKRQFDLIVETYAKVSDTEDQPKKPGIRNWQEKLDAIE